MLHMKFVYVLYQLLLDVLGLLNVRGLLDSIGVLSCVPAYENWFYRLLVDGKLLVFYSRVLTICGIVSKIS